MAKFQEDSTDDEIGVNLQLAEKLSINKGDHVPSNNKTFSKKDQKQLCNQRRKKLFRDDQSSSSSSLEMQNDPSSARLPNAYLLHNKKRQNGDKNIELLANPKRTCLSDRFSGFPEKKDQKSKSTNRDVKYSSRIVNFPSQPLNLTKRNIFPDNTYEDHLNKFSEADDSDFETQRHFTRKKNLFDGENSRTLKKHVSNSSVQPSFHENQPLASHSVQFLDSTSDEDSRTVMQNGALKGGRQSPDPMSFKKVLGRKMKKVIDSDDTDDDNDWPVNYRNRRLVFSSSDSDNSGPSNKVNKKPVDAALKKSANLSFSSGDSFNSNHDHRYHKPDTPLFETFRVDSPIFHEQMTEPTTSNYRGRNTTNKYYKTRSSNRANEPPFLHMPFQNFDSYLPADIDLPDHAGEDGSLSRNPCIPHSRNLRSHQHEESIKSSKGRSFAGANLEREKPQHPFHADLFDSVGSITNNRPPSQPSYSGFCPVENNTHLQDGDAHLPVDQDWVTASRRRAATIPKIPRNHRRTHGSKSAKCRSLVGACSQKGKSNLAARYPDLFDAEDSSEVEFFTANSYSDTESNTESLTNMRRINSVHRNQPVHLQEMTSDSINVGSSEDEISVVFTSVPQPQRNSEQRRGAPRTLGRRYSRGSRRHVTNTQDVVSLSPDPVEQVRQMEEDERFARMLQAQFDAETDPTYAPCVRQSPDPCQMTMREPSSSTDDDSIDLEVFPRESAHGFFQFVQGDALQSLHPHPFNIVPTVSRRGSFRIRRPDTRSRRRWAGEEARLNIARLFDFQSPSFISYESSDDSYEAFLGIADLNGDVARGLQKAEINRLPTRKYITPNSASTSHAAELPHKRADLNKECQVCLSDYVNGDVLRILPCFHEFHTPCIDPWLKINHTCPVCRVIVDLEE